MSQLGGMDVTGYQVDAVDVTAGTVREVENDGMWPGSRSRPACSVEHI
jgi:hypothetical protein